MRRHPLVPAVAALAFAAVLGTAGSARAQYFGRNDVRWEHLKFSVLKTEHFDLYYYPEGKEAKFVNGVLDHMARAAQPQAFA